MSESALAQRVGIPRWQRVLFAAALAAQLVVFEFRPAAYREAQPVPPAPSLNALRALASGDPELLSAALVLRLQSFDDQPGASIPFRELDYVRVAAWLDRALALDPASAYPLLLAAQVYSQVPDARRVRVMLDFVQRAFLADPDGRWRWLAHAAIIARHRIHDERLALSYARELAERAHDAPSWARQMHILLLDDMGEHEQAKVLLGALLASGSVSDPGEIRLLTARLAALRDRAPDRAAAAR